MQVGPTPSTPPSPVFKPRITPFQSFMIGYVAAAIEVLLNQPFFNAKLQVQTGQKVSRNLRVAYVGAGARTNGLGINVALQMTINALFRRSLLAPNEEPTDLQRMGMGFGSGLISGLCVAGWIEQLLVFQNQSIARDVKLYNGKHGRAERMNPPPEIMRGIKANNTFIKRSLEGLKIQGVSRLKVGMWGSAWRDGFFALGYIGLAPWMEKQMRERCSEGSWWPYTARPLAGAIVSLASQPFDTVKIAQQGAITPDTLVRTARKIVENEGVKGLYKGGLYRLSVVMSAVSVYRTFSEYVERWIEGPQR